MVIRKGSVYWVDFSPGKGSEPLGMRPGLVIQSDVLNDTKINTVIMLAITSTLKFGELPGNVVLQKGEANMLRIPMISAGDSDGRRPPVPRQGGRYWSERSDAGFFLFSKYDF
jgi:mRNA-degrading endonuclease toxin of MazEF toxin-antitoxin module